MNLNGNPGSLWACTCSPGSTNEIRVVFGGLKSESSLGTEIRVAFGELRSESPWGTEIRVVFGGLKSESSGQDGIPPDDADSRTVRQILSLQQAISLSLSDLLSLSLFPSFSLSFSL